MHLGFRGKVFLAVFGVAASALMLVATLVSISIPEQTSRRIEQSLISEAHLVADILARHDRDAGVDALDAEADRLGQALPARVTLVARDGSVVGDSDVRADELFTLENHASRPEVVAALSQPVGSSRRHSHTVQTDLLYVAVRVDHPRVAVVRLALPLTEVRAQVRAVRQTTLLALALALLAALALAAVSSTLLVRRLDAMAATARRYAAGDLSPSTRHHERDEIGTVARVLDDTVRELATRVDELARDRARTDAILAGMVEGVIVVNAGGRVQLVNDAARRMLGIDQATPAAHYLELVRHPGVTSLLTEALHGQSPAGLDLSPVRTPERRLIARAAPVTAPGAQGAVLVLHDITDLRRADQMRRDFVANVSHELRTPLTAIRGYVEALMDDLPGPEDRRHFLEVIARHAQRMERLVKDLLRLAGLDARQEPVETSEVALQTLFAGTVSDLRPVIDSRQQQIEIRVDDAVTTIVTDAAKLQDVLRNLLENAVNYSPEGRRIQIEASCRDQHAIISVSDEGPGIPDSDLQRIFERFYRVDKARSRESGGTGLGLSIVRHLVDLLGGRVWAENRPGGGAVFTVSLPVAGPTSTSRQQGRALAAAVDRA